MKKNGGTIDLNWENPNAWESIPGTPTNVIQR